MSSNIGIQRRAADAQAGPTLKVSNEQALQMLRTKMAQRLSSQASGGELRRSFELMDRDKSGNVELAELEEASAASLLPHWHANEALRLCAASIGALTAKNHHTHAPLGFPALQHQPAGESIAQPDGGVRRRRQRTNRFPGVY